MTIERRAAASANFSIKTKTEQNKTNVTPEKDVMTSANQTPGGYKFAPLVLCTIVIIVSLHAAEYVVLFSLYFPGSVFLPCDHGPDF